MKPYIPSDVFNMTYEMYLLSFLIYTNLYVIVMLGQNLARNKNQTSLNMHLKIQSNQLPSTVGPLGNEFLVYLSLGRTVL